MTADEEKAILLKAVDEALAAGSIPFETRIHHLSTAARRLHAEAAEIRHSCPRCGRLLTEAERGPDGYDVGCLKLIFAEKGLSVAKL
jgi:hypothetical protein